MPDTTKLIQFGIAQWSRPDAERPKLAAPVSASATTLTFTKPLLDEDGNVIDGNTLIGIKDRKGYTESVWIPAGEMSADGLTATNVVRGVDLSGLDYSTQNDSDLAVKHEADDVVICQISAVYINMIVSAVMGVIATGANNLKVGDGTSADVSYYAQNDHTTKPRVYFDDDKGYWKVHWGDNEPTGGAYILGGTFADLTEANTYTWPDDGVIISAANVTYFREGGAWVANQAGGSVANASTTVAGKKEDPTDSEFHAGTNTGGTGATMSPTPSQIGRAIQNKTFTYAATSTGNDSYAITTSFPITGYQDGQEFDVKLDVGNTGPFTLNVDGQGAINCKKPDGTDPASGEYLANSIVKFKYNSTGPKFQIETPSALTPTTSTDPSENWYFFPNRISNWESSDTGTGSKTVALASAGQIQFATSGASNDAEVAYRNFPSFGNATSSLAWSHLTSGKKIIFEISASSQEASATNEELRFGFAENVSQATTETSNVTQMKFFLDDNQAKVVVCDGTGAVTTQNITVNNQERLHVYRIEYTVGSSVVFKVDGTTVHTATTNIPLNSDTGSVTAFVALKTTSAEINSCYFSDDVYIAIQK